MICISYNTCVLIPVIFCTLFSSHGIGANMIISGILDSKKLYTNRGMVLELYAFVDIHDLSSYGIGIATGKRYRSSGVIFTFPNHRIPAHSYIHIIHVVGMHIDGKGGYSSFLNKNIQFVYLTDDSRFTCYGKEAVALYKGGRVYDVVGVMGQDGMYTWWYYLYRWFYRKPGARPSAPTWKPSQWTQSPSAITDWSSNNKNANPFPAMSFGQGKYFFLCKENQPEAWPLRN